MFWFSDNGFKKKDKVGRVFIFCFHIQRVKNITQTSSILLFWQTNNTIVFTRRELDFPTDTSYFRCENTVFVSFNVQLRSKQIVPWTILPVDRTMTVAELCKSIFVGDFTDIKEVGENNNPFGCGDFFCMAIKTSHRLKFLGGGVV
jgi:hypothetical protein